MQPHQQRVVDEKSELDVKIEKLTSFFSNSIFSGLPEDEQGRLKSQVHYMSEYSRVLGERINCF